MRVRKLAGVGVGLRWAFLDDVAHGAADGRVEFFEVSPENYMRRGGYYPAALERVAERHRIVTHGLMMSLGSTDPLNDSYFRELRRWLDRFDPPWHSDHLCFSGIHGALLHDLLPVPFTWSMARHVAARIREARDRLQRPIAVENVSYYLELGHAEMSEAQFIAEVTEQADCLLLLDVNNLDVNATNHGIDARRWLDEIPMNRVVEIHVAGPEPWDQGLLLDTHGAPVRPSVYALLEEVVARTGPVPVLLERDNNIPPLHDLLVEADMVDQTYQRALRRWQAAHPSAEASHVVPP